MENTRENCGLPRETSVSILVMSEMNVPRTATEEAIKILTRSKVTKLRLVTKVLQA
uniref:Uncharacterized protein n=1 Tax=Chloroidium ellipsoideum TaxID=63676 RepID=Q31980_9CHLO|nr:hypothetical protein [Chloroidium ellipsoideum]